MLPQTMLSSLLHQYRAPILLIILAFAFVTRIAYFDQPDGYYFDEVYHSVTARLIAENDQRAFEWWHPAPEPNTAIDWLHPPVAKYFQAGSVLLFGANSFGYRFSSIIFGVLVILLIYHLAQALLKDSRLSLLAAALASFDGLLLVQSRIAMNDIHVTAGILLSTWCFVQYQQKQASRWLLLTGLVTGITIATKWSGVFLLPAFFSILFFRWLTTDHQLHFKKILQVVSGLIVIPALIYVMSYALMFSHGKDLDHFLDLHWQIWQYQTRLTATHPYQSQPWEWVLNTTPVWYHVEYISDEQRANIYAQGNTPLYWLGAVAVLSATSVVVQKKLRVLNHLSNDVSLKNIIRSLSIAVSKEPLVSLLIFYFVFWVPWLFSPRILFFYHYTPAVPFLSILLAWWLLRSPLLRERRWLQAAVYLLIGIWFVVWYPYWTATPVSVDLTTGFYQRFEIWK